MREKEKKKEVVLFRVVLSPGQVGIKFFSAFEQSSSTGASGDEALCGARARESHAHKRRRHYELTVDWEPWILGETF